MRRSRLSAGTWLALSAGVLAVATLVAIGAALLASHQLTQARRRVVDRVDVASNTALVLSNAMVNQETGVRGFVLGGEEGFLDPYRAGVVNAARAQRELETLARAEMRGRLPGDLTAARRAIAAWESGYAGPRSSGSAGSARAGSRTPPSRPARRASTPCAPRSAACRPICGPTAPPRAPIWPARQLAHAGAGLRGDPAGAGAGGHRA